MALLDVFQNTKMKEEFEQTRQELDTVRAQLEQTRQELDAVKPQFEQTQKERDAYKKLLADTGKLTIIELQRGIAQLEARKSRGNQEMESLRQLYYQRKQAVEQQLKLLDDQVAEKKNELVMLDEEILLQSFGFYKSQYDLQSSEAYKNRLEQVRERQATLVKSGKAASSSKTWTVNNSQKEGERMIKDYTKLIVRSFNNECDASMVKVRFNNIESTKKKIQKAFDTLNNLGRAMEITIASNYLSLKLEELNLCYEYQVKKQEEKEEQKRIREEMREQARLTKEIEEMKLKLDKESKHFDNALAAVNERLTKAGTDAEREVLEKEKASIEAELEQLEKNRLDVEMREQNTRAGYVYVISNIGSFGENVYKIGVTRRLEPEERVDELGDASVPFDFDIHAMIFSEDAPALENALHKAFESSKLNMINSRREFFNVSLEDIERVVKTNFNKPVEFTLLPEAAQYRQSLMLKEQSSKSNASEDGATVQIVASHDPFA